MLLPSAPDLFAQLARADAAGRSPLWLASWYGGIPALAYSVISGWLMHLVGVRTVGVIATVVIAERGGRLVEASARPRRAAAAVSVAALLNLFSGRVTFALGCAALLTTLVGLRDKRKVGAVLTGALSALAAPLAGAALIIAALAVGATDGARRRLALAVAGAAGLPLLIVAALFPTPTHGSFSAPDLLLCEAVCAVIAGTAGVRAVRFFALLLGATALGLFVLPNGMGAVIARVPMLAAVPLVLATATRRRARTLTALAVVGLATWPTASFAADLRPVGDASATAAYFGPLIAHLPATIDGRVEVVDTRTHAADAYLADRVALARGWERQIDVAVNPLFYAGPLSSATYRAWLDTWAVRYVAVPDDPIDFGYADESRLVASGPPYLRLTWTGAHWRLYRVVTPTPLVGGARSAALEPDGTVAFATTAGGTFVVRQRYSRLLALVDSNGTALPGGVSADQDGTTVTVPSAGCYRLTAAIDPEPASACA